MHEVEIGDETGDGRYCIVPQCRVDDQGLVERRNPLEAILADYLPPLERFTSNIDSCLPVPLVCSYDPC